MMLKQLLLAAVLLLAACQSAAPSATRLPTATAVLVNETQTPAPRWLETEMNGVSLGMWWPNGWESDQSDGLVLAEHTASASGALEGGMLVYCFVPPADEFKVTSAASNYAWAVLNQVITKPSSTGWDVAISPPTGFDWDHLSAAYYLLTTGDGVRAVVLALALPSGQRVVVCNISIPMAQADRIRAMMPQLLDGMMINGNALHGAALAALPDPLPFPHYSLNATSESDATNSP